LRYNFGTLARGLEWTPGATSQPGYPANVDVVNGGTVDVENGSTGTALYVAKSLTVQGTSKLQMGAMTAPLRVGTILLGTGTLELSSQAGGDMFVGGDWMFAGTLTSNGRRVTLDGSGPQSVMTSNSFANLDVVATAARTVTFTAGATQTVSGTLNLTGAAGNLLLLRSSTPGTQWKLVAPTATSASFVDVQDSDASGGEEIDAGSNSVDSGNNLNWTFGSAGTLPTDRFRAVDNDPDLDAWNDVTTWESSHDGFTWIPATLTPDNNATQITIDAVQRVTVTASVTVDNLSVGSGAILEVASGATLTVNDGFGTDVDVSAPSELRVLGTLINNGQIKISGGRLADVGETASITGNAIEYLGGILRYSKNAGVTSNVEFPSSDGPSSVWIDGGVTLHEPRTIPSGVMLFDGSQFDITAGLTLGDGCLIQRGTGSFVGTPTFGTYVSLSYQSGTGAMTTGSEIPPAGINVRDLAVAAGFPVTLASDITVDGSIVLSDNVITGDKALTIVEGIPVSGPNLPTRGFVIGNVKRVFSSSDTFVYPVGTANGYSPVTVAYNITTPGIYSQTVRATQSAHPALIDPSKALSRYWTLSDVTGPAAITADITFNYLDPTDIPATATEGNFLLLKYDGGVMSQTGGTVNTSNNTATVTGVSTFSVWTLSELAVTAAPVSLSGRVRTQTGQGIGNVIVTISGGETGETRSVKTNAFGLFEFEGLRPGMTYVVSVASRKYMFSQPARVLSLTGSLADVDFIADPH
jgi:hypothetical protein